MMPTAFDGPLMVHWLMGAVMSGFGLVVVLLLISFISGGSAKKRGGS